MNFEFIYKASAVDRGLNRCAALLSNILDNEDKGKFSLSVRFHVLSGIFDHFPLYIISFLMHLLQIIVF